MKSINPYKIKTSPNAMQGFTLMELIVVLFLIVIMMAWGIPEYQDLKARRSATEFSNEMVYSFTLARAEAVRYGTFVTVEPNGSWQGGWTITAAGVDGAADVVIGTNNVGPGIVLDPNGSAPNSIVFNSIGGLEGASEAEIELNNHNQSGTERTVVVNMSGSSRVISR